MLTMTGLLARAAETFGGRVAVMEIAADGTLRETGWADHVMRARRIAGGFRFLAGERFAIIARNSAGQAELFHAGYLSGALPVPLNWRLSPVELAALLADCDPARVFLDREFADLADDPALARWLADAILLDGGRLPDDCLGDAAPLHDTVAEDAALILYTGGTTGGPKGVLLSHGNITANALQVAPVLEMAEHTRYLHIAPMFHGADLIGTAATMLGGAHAYLPAFTIDEFLASARTARITATMLVPAMVRMLVDRGVENPADIDLPDLAMVIYGSSPMDAGLIGDACRAMPGIGWRQGYGLTETGPLLTVLGAAEHRDIAIGARTGLAASAGRPLAGVVSRTVDAAGNPLPAGAVGEIQVCGPNIARGYFKNPAETRAVFRDGWFLTGDIGRVDGDGYLYLLDRAKDMIISGGENIYSIEVEDALLAHPGVAQAAVIGQPDPKWGEIVTAAVVLRDPDLTAAALQDHCRTMLGGYKVPRRFLFMDDLPRNALGKVLKQHLREGAK